MISALLAAAILGGGCALRDVTEQVEMLERACAIEGQVVNEASDGQSVVVVLTQGDAEAGSLPTPVDFTLPEQSGEFSFALAPGRYQLMAFSDLDGDLELDDNEPARPAHLAEGISCGAGERVASGTIGLRGADRLDPDQDYAVQAGRTLVADAMESAVSLGQLTVFGDVVALDDPRFDLETARDSLWRPVNFLRAGYGGVYMRDEFDASKIPILFIHGINGSPRVLEPMIDALDGDRFQALYFYYPSGLRIGQVVWHLDRIMRELEHRHGFERYHVVAHSMGGLVARAWLLERRHEAARAQVGVFLSLSTPWSGYPSARQGVDHSPVVVPVWRDMATGSDFLESLFADGTGRSALPPHHLLFSFRQSGWLSGSSGDGVAALASMLPPPVQRQAASVFGVDAGHVDILSDEVAQARVLNLLRACCESR
jgi:pimeloyl-ACP methyl ester carboxylesterase